jgi:hypothetical protein
MVVSGTLIWMPMLYFIGNVMWNPPTGALTGIDHTIFNWKIIRYGQTIVARPTMDDSREGDSSGEYANLTNPADLTIETSDQRKAMFIRKCIVCDGLAGEERAGMVSAIPFRRLTAPIFTLHTVPPVTEIAVRGTGRARRIA